MAELMHFAPSDIYLTRHEAWATLKFFWPAMTLSEDSLTTDDRGFAQALLVEAIDASYAMGYVEILFNSFYGKVPGSFVDVRSMIKDFMKKAAKYWFKHLGSQSIDKAEIYETVRRTIALNFRSVIEIQEQTGELIY